jgi:hypothetical protein
MNLCVFNKEYCVLYSLKERKKLLIAMEDLKTQLMIMNAG